MKSVAERPALYPVPSSPAPAPSWRAKSREGKKLLLTPLDPQLHRELKHRAIDEGMTAEGIVQASIASYLAKPASNLA